MSDEPVWLSAEDIVALNQQIVGHTKEPFSIVNPSGLESAQAKPINHYSYGEEDIVALAVELCLGLARNHCFLQGNKRTAFAALYMFLWQNGYELDIPDEDDTAEILIRVIEHQIPDHIFKHTIEDYTRER